MNSRVSTFLRLSIRPWGLLTAAGGVACVATLFGSLGRCFWFLDLFSHFRVQYLIGLGILAAVFLLGHRRKTAVVLLLFTCINLGVVLPLYVGGAASTPDGGTVLRAMLINVNTRNGDAVRVREVVQANDPDILVLEEINSRWMGDLVWLTNAYPHSRVQPREDNFGIGLFSKLPLAESEVVYIGESDVPTIVATVLTGHHALRIVATHPLPPAGAEYSRLRNDQLTELPNYISSAQPTLLLGDLNVTPWNYHFKRLVKRSGLRDSARGHGLQPTWPNFSLLLRIPLDHCLHSPNITVIDRNVGADVRSDHYPVIVDFSIATVTPGP